MPDAACLNEVGRFMACEEGCQFLDGIRVHLKGHTITEVEFTADGEHVTTILCLSNGQCYTFNDEELYLETLREQFGGLFRELARHNTPNVRKGDKHDEQQSIAT